MKWARESSLHVGDQEIGRTEGCGGLTLAGEKGLGRHAENCVGDVVFRATQGVVLTGRKCEVPSWHWLLVRGRKRKHIFKKIYVKMVFGGPSHWINTPLLKTYYLAHAVVAHFFSSLNLKTFSCWTFLWVTEQVLFYLIK